MSLASVIMIVADTLAPNRRQGISNNYADSTVVMLSYEWHHAVRIALESLTHWGRMTHICVGKLTIIGSDNGLSPGRRQVIIWTNAVILLIWSLGTNFSQFVIEIQTFSLKKIRLKMSSAKCCPSGLGLNVWNKLCSKAVGRSTTRQFLCYWRVRLLMVSTLYARTCKGRGESCPGYNNHVYTKQEDCSFNVTEHWKGNVAIFATGCE